MLAFTTALLAVEAVFPRSESELLAILPGLLSANVAVLQPEIHPEQPLAPLFGTTRTAASSGGFSFARAAIGGEGGVHADATVIPAAMSG
jgi:hypothetical protein